MWTVELFDEVREPATVRAWAGWLRKNDIAGLVKVLRRIWCRFNVAQTKYGGRKIRISTRTERQLSIGRGIWSARSLRDTIQKHREEFRQVDAKARTRED